MEREAERRVFTSEPTVDIQVGEVTGPVVYQANTVTYNSNTAFTPTTDWNWYYKLVKTS